MIIVSIKYSNTRIRNKRPYSLTSTGQCKNERTFSIDIETRNELLKINTKPPVDLHALMRKLNVTLLQ